LLKLFLLVPPERRFAAHAYPGAYPDQGDGVCLLLAEWRIAGDAASGTYDEQGHGFCPSWSGGHDSEREAQDQAVSEGTRDCTHARTFLLEPTCDTHVACHVEKLGAIMEFLKKTRQLCRVRSKVVRSPGDLSLVKNVQAHPNHGVTNFFPFSVDRQS